MGTAIDPVSTSGAEEVRIGADVVLEESATRADLFLEAGSDTDSNTVSVESISDTITLLDVDLDTGPDSLLDTDAGSDTDSNTVSVESISDTITLLDVDLDTEPDSLLDTDSNTVSVESISDTITLLDTEPDSLLDTDADFLLEDLNIGSGFIKSPFWRPIPKR